MRLEALPAASELTGHRWRFSGSALIATVLSLQGLWFALRGEDSLVAVMPDDAFYYFVLGKNFAALGHWTFDGIAPTTGFHLAWGYLIAALYAAWPAIDFWPLWIITAIIGITCLALSALLLERLLRKTCGSSAGIAVALVVLGGVLLRVPFMGMESPLLILAAALSAFVVFNGGGCASAAILGFAGMMARSDFGLLPLCLLTVTASQGLSSSNPAARSQCLRAAMLFAGAIAGLAAVTAHSWWISGTLVQNSALMKAHWSSFSGADPVKALSIAANVLCYNIVLPLPVMGLFVLLPLAALSFWAVRRHGHDWVMPAAGALSSAGYAALYSLAPQAIQPWYSASFAIPITLLIAPGIAYLARPEAAPTRKAVCTGFAAAIAAGGILGAQLPLWPYQVTLRDAGRFLARHPELGPVGAFNGGLISYFSNRSLVNLDGLVNDDIYPYAKAGALADYVRARKMAFILDYEIMFTRQDVAQRGGYGNGKLFSCMTSLANFSAVDATRQWTGSDLKLFRVDPLCLR